MRALEGVVTTVILVVAKRVVILVVVWVVRTVVLEVMAPVVSRRIYKKIKLVPCW